MDWLHILMLIGVGAVAGFINVNAGGGSSLTLPALYFLGLDWAEANGTNRIALILQNIFAVASFKKRGVFAFRSSLALALFTLPGAIIGAIIATRVSNYLFQRILGMVLIFVIVSMFSTRSYRDKHAKQGEKSWLIYPALFAIGFYGGFIQVGVGFLFMASLYHLLRENLVKVNMHKVFIILIYTIAALVVFSLSGNVNWIYGLILAGGNALGGWWGAHAAVKGGEKFIRIILILAIFIIVLKLFNLF
ncbi:MAG: TSUP family transporter [Candidatus Aminicenantes bacterium]|nr:TSUP family transporter [Candidatus Aminicenantes bacterium]